MLGSFEPRKEICVRLTIAFGAAVLGRLYEELGTALNGVARVYYCLKDWTTDGRLH